METADDNDLPIGQDGDPWIDPGVIQPADRFPTTNTGIQPLGRRKSASVCRTSADYQSGAVTQFCRSLSISRLDQIAGWTPSAVGNTEDFRTSSGN
jgi:hypothetical protein